MSKAVHKPAARSAADEVEAVRPIPRLPLAFAIIGGLTIGLGLAGRQFGAPGVVLGLAGAALVAVISAFWASVRTMIGEARISSAEAFAIGNTGGALEQKRAVLRALKDLEFERAVGKISDEDFKVLVARYRAEAKRLLKQIDEASAEQRGRAEELVNKRLEKLGLLPSSSEQQPVAFEKAKPTEPATTEPATTEPAVQPDATTAPVAVEEDEDEVADKLVDKVVDKLVEPKKEERGDA